MREDLSQSCSNLAMSSAGEGSSQDQEFSKIENGELDLYNTGTLDEMHRLDQSIDASTEVSSNL